jgi:predicted flap endonuclease-1-like 5' DNA nuclease
LTSFAIPITWLSPGKRLKEKSEASEPPHGPPHEPPHEPPLGGLVEVPSQRLKPVDGPRVYEVNAREPVFASVFGLHEAKLVSPKPNSKLTNLEILPSTLVPQELSLPIVQDDLEEMERELLAMSELSYAVDVVGAQAAGFMIDLDQPLRAIKGIGPKTLALLSAANIQTFPDLADASVSQLKNLLLSSGPYHRLAKPAHWIRQANLAALNQWGSLRQLQGPAKKPRRAKVA